MPDKLLPEDDSEIRIVPDHQRDPWLTAAQKREPRRVPTTRELFDALDRKRAKEEDRK